MKVLVDVDVQNDFCDPSGALYVSGSPRELFTDLVRAAQRAKMPIVGSVDSHAYDAWEFASSPGRGPDGDKPNFPDHCVKGTWGWLKVPGTLPARFRFAPCVPGLDAGALATELAGGATQGLYFEKEVYSLFVNPNAEAVLRALEEQAGEALELWVFGVATDYCVRAAVLGLRERGYATVVIDDAVRGITREGTEAALAAMRASGARIMSSSELLGGRVSA